MLGHKSSWLDDETPDVVHAAWQVRLYDELAEKTARRRQAATVRQAALVGALLGLAGCFALHLI